MASSPSYASLLKRSEALEQENAALREALGLSEPTTVDTWAKHAPQHLRDQMAATALIAEKLDEPRALIRLGFHCEKNATKRWTPEVWVTAQQIFDTPGVKAILARNLEDAEANKAAIIARLVQTSMHGSDGDAVRAAQQLAKIADWNNSDKGALPTSLTVNLLQMLGENEARKVNSTVSEVDTESIIDAEHFCLYEPGEATLVLDDESVAAKR